MFKVSPARHSNQYAGRVDFYLLRNERGGTHMVVIVQSQFSVRILVTVSWNCDCYVNGILI